MQTITAIDRQTLFDVALQVYGRAELAYDLALANDLVLSDQVPAGTVLQVPTVSGKTDAAVVDAYELHGLTPATAASAAETDALNPEGISYWYVKAPVPAFVVTPDTDSDID